MGRREEPSAQTAGTPWWPEFCRPVCPRQAKHVAAPQTVFFPYSFRFHRLGVGRQILIFLTFPFAPTFYYEHFQTRGAAGGMFRCRPCTHRTGPLVTPLPSAQLPPRCHPGSGLGRPGHEQHLGRPWACGRVPPSLPPLPGRPRVSSPFLISGEDIITKTLCLNKVTFARSRWTHVWGAHQPAHAAFPNEFTPGPRGSSPNPDLTIRWLPKTCVHQGRGVGPQETGVDLGNKWMR